MRANEEGIRWMVQNVAALAAVTFAPGIPTRSRATRRSIRGSARIWVCRPAPRPSRTSQTELAGAQHTLQAATERHRETKSMLGGMLENIEGVSNEQTAAAIIALQTRLQASLQTTSLLYQTSLVNYL